MTLRRQVDRGDACLKDDDGRVRVRIDHHRRVVDVVHIEPEGRRGGGPGRILRC